MLSITRAKALPCEARRAGFGDEDRAAQGSFRCAFGGKDMSKRRRCIVVADGSFARILLDQPETPGLELIEHSEVENCSSPVATQSPRIHVHDDGGHRATALDHAAGRRVDIDPKFAAAVAQHIGTIVRGWQGGCVVIAAAPDTLGMLRAVVQGALHDGVELKALAKDYVSLSARELAARLDF